MTNEQILSNLCDYDTRNPDFLEWPDYYEESDKRQPRTDCSCDNCFYRRDALALEILALQGRLESANERIGQLEFYHEDGD